jgi:hypothetical protein
MCFDTTASNIGSLKGTCVLLEEKIVLLEIFKRLVISRLDMVVLLFRATISCRKASDNGMVQSTKDE